ncbi:HC-toxin efflux carrier TOXA [Penicillium chermesinum]|nr:HC-toxin efflux carrier TOXA [Penicillium chermesinum]
MLERSSKVAIKESDKSSPDLDAKAPAHEAQGTITDDKSSPSTQAADMHSSQEKLTKKYTPTEEKLSIWKLVPITVALCATLFCMSLDQTILATAIPKITTQFSSLDDVAWYGSSYLLATCAVQLMFGKLYTFYPSKWVFLCALLIFEVGSVVCGAAPTSDALIVGRCVAGLGAAGLFSGALIIVNTTVPLRVRPMYIGLVSSMHAVASVAGPIMGGAFTDHVTWRWCFYINLPFGGLAVICVLLFLPSNTVALRDLPWREKVKQLDLPGFVLLAPSIICLILALQWGGTSYPWRSGRIIALFVVFGLLFIGFWAVQVWQEDLATIPIRIIKNRNVWGGIFYGTMISASLFVFTFYIPIWFQAIKGDSATQSGIDNLPMLIGLVVFAIIGGVLASTTGYYTPFLILSAIITSVGAGMLTTLEVDSGIGVWFGYQVLLVAGAGIGAQNMLLISSVAVEKVDMPITTSVLTFTQVLSAAIFLPIGQSVFQNRLVVELSSRISASDAAIVVNAGATGFQKSLSSKVLPLALEGYNKAITETFYVGVACGALSIVGTLVLEWLSIKDVKNDHDKKDEEKGIEDGNTRADAEGDRPQPADATQT